MADEDYGEDEAIGGLLRGREAVGGAPAASSSSSSNFVGDIPFCGFISLRYYQPYFDVDTSEIGSRLIGAATGYKVGWSGCTV